MMSVSDKAKIGKNVKIGDYSIIHDNVVIGDNTIIESHCVIGHPTPLAKGKPLTIGDNSLIRSHTVIYEGSELGDHLMTGHSVFIREKCIAGSFFRVGTQSDIQGDCTIGSYVNIHSNVFVAKLSEIGNFCWVFPGVAFTSDPFPPVAEQDCKGAIIKDMSIICAKTLLLPDTTVGLGSFVAAGSTVRFDIPDIHCAAGNPAAVFRRIDKFFNPYFGTYHPWIRRVKERYPEKSYELMDSIIKKIDLMIADDDIRNERKRA